MDIAIDRILNCKPNTREYNEIKKLKETRERAETLVQENSEMERRVNDMRNELDEAHKEVVMVSDINLTFSFKFINT